jgi:hypothetical protein
MGTNVKLEKSVRVPLDVKSSVRLSLLREDMILSMEHVPGVIAFKDELIIQALLACTFSKSIASKSTSVRLTRGCKLPNLDKQK